MSRAPGLALLVFLFALSPMAFAQGADVPAAESPPAAAPPASTAAPAAAQPQGYAAPPKQPAAEPAKEAGGDEMPPAVTEEPRISRQGMGIDPGALQYGGLSLPPPPGSQLTTTNLKPGQINFHGFLRAPMRIGIGSGEGLPPGVDSGIKLHSPPRVPDSAYTEWQYTNNLGGPWTELQFSYGNARVFGNVMIASYNLTDANYKELTAQLGINQAWVTVNLPELFGPRGGILWNVGGFAGRYGSAGRYDAGEYETYLFGRTHTTGETLSAFYDLTPGVTLQLEHGIGARVDVPPFGVGAPDLPYLPYAGPVQQLPTMLHHVHGGVTIKDKLILAAHYLTSWTQASTDVLAPDGHISSMGVEAKMVDTQFGNGYLGFGHIDALHAIRVAGALEALHSWEGWSLTENFFGEGADGTGQIDTVMGQYTFSLATFLQGTEAFWGQSADLLATVYGMYNRVSSDDPAFTGATSKLKLGSEVTYIPLFWLGFSGRYDLVQPNMDNSNQSFQVVSPRVILRTSFVSNEEILFQYSQYFNGSETKLAFPYADPPVAADKQVFSIIANMYW